MSSLGFIVFVIILAVILLVISLLVNPLLGIFAASIVVCMWLEYQRNGYKKS